MNPSYSVYSENQRSTVIDPYYVKGDVFQRDSRYYDQVINSRRNRTPNKSGFPLDASQISNNIRSNTGVNPTTVLSGPIITNSGSVIQPTNSNVYTNQPADSVNQITVSPPQTQMLNNAAQLATSTTAPNYQSTTISSQPIPTVVNNNAE
jgi:cytoskeletal protein RodZ